MNLSKIELFYGRFLVDLAAELCLGQSRERVCLNGSGGQCD